ncbi:hypothetical protein ACSNOI_30065 [Actinomadura kijaniata]|uniref:hypothetical protein n=1 Tax=Actinomadura kijaniata TaxID=46161 RepID=UPI003F1DEAA2
MRWIDVPAEEARQRMLARGWPGQVVNDILQAQADLATVPGPRTSTVQEITGTPARTFRQWADDNVDRFRDTVRATR